MFVLSAFCLAFATSGAQAANRFLATPIPIEAEPLIDQTNGDFDFTEAENGDAVALWGQTDGLFASIRPGTGTFGEPFEVADFFNAGTSLPELAMAPNGYTVAVWRQSIDGESQVMAASRAAGATSFSAPVQVSTEPFQVPNVDPQVDVADNGTALVAWVGRDIDGDANSSRVRKRFLNPGGSLGLPPTNASNQGVGFPDVAVGPNGHSLITWVVGDSITGDPATLWMSPGGADQDTQIFDTNNGSWLTAAVDADGNAVIADRVGNDIIGNHRPTGAGQDFLFDQSLKIPGSSVGRPQISMDAAGKATVAFNYAMAGQDGIQTVDRAPGSGTLFGTTTKAVPESADITQLEIASGANGVVIMGWVREDDRVYSAVRDAGAPQFAVPTGPISPPAEFGNVRVGADSEGKAIIAYSTSADPAEDFSLNALPYDDVPTASDLVIPGEPVQGVETAFSVNPTDPWAAVTGIEWEVDEGVKLEGPQVKHTYMTPGDQMVVLTLTDALGNKTTTGQLVQVQPDVTPPKLTKVSMLKKKSKRGKKNAFRFTLSDQARIVIKVKRTSKGKGRKAQGKIVRKKVAAGKRRISFRGRIGKRKLKPARYRATIVAVDQFGNKSKPRKLGFRIIK